MNKVKLEILGLSPSQSQTGSFALILMEESGNRRLPIIIGMFEAQAIAIEMERISPNRPMTHDLFKSFSTAFDFMVEEVIISNLQEGIFYAKIVCSDGIRTKNIDARPSDAIAIALRFNASIYTNEEIMQEASISTEDEENDASMEAEIEELVDRPAGNPDGNLRNKSLTELHKLLDSALQSEAYERAAAIRDEIERRN
ncbi:MAG: bifunctional nuclease family protein [Spirosomaceae bacterium]|nr:bifunctional nuclease family protein [Spirosomataceae bacterium]